MSADRGNTLVVMTFFLAALAILVAVLIDLDQVRQAQVTAETAAQAAAADGARIDLAASTLYPLCPPYEYCPRTPRVTAILDDDALQLRVRATLARNLHGIAYLLYKLTPEQVADRAEIAVVNPRRGACERNPFDVSNPDRCYYEPFVALRVRVPLKALWGGLTFEYPVMVVAAATDDVSAQRPATPVPTWTPIGPLPTFPAPRPTCDPSVCG